ncbi:MAG: hypothetical protein JO121_23935 [Deltaproteobacteria bacterium]|nr:hypothetical protein [Deltaproteobacteria bacterium]
MKILKRRDKLGKTITVRVPTATKIELDQLRKRAVAAGFDLGTTLRESLTSTIRQIRSELDTLERAHPIPTGNTATNGVNAYESARGEASEDLATKSASAND